MYKRAVRIVFLGNPRAVAAAAACAARLGGGRIEGRARVPSGQGAAASAGHAATAELAAEDLVWADLCVSLDAAVTLPTVRSGLTVRYWTGAPASTDVAAYAAFLETQVAGILGGLQLLDRLDASP
ncbi:MAG: hypothetical protein ACYCRH_12175 [Acidiferrobacteraceae bacterium]